MNRMKLYRILVIGVIIVFAAALPIVLCLSYKIKGKSKDKFTITTKRRKISHR